MSRMFLYADDFNEDIGGWDASSLTDMRCMFDSAIDFNQDLSDWCVSLISSEPEDFSMGSTSWTEPQPVWGTCP